ncbi:hypothetical protein [Croceicoccus pelagius]|uniref:DUF2157 domain-containing protein n=1 Tax=Croceicoccus pelagius TaxID=1703341 RepID=A0A916YJK4_9SPHN|nr:hypothetical protein [Croceicoccus pelagius]GGD48232.1 hypothetical protein GCM10010989_23280 [Croceicoccus pelagius]
MYSDEDLNSAVAAGAISSEAANALRAHVADLRQIAHGDEESFRLLNSFNDIFVTVAAVILLIAMGTLGSIIFAPLGPLFVGAAAWALGEYFALRRRMALPSVVLTVAFIGSVVALPIAVAKLGLPRAAVDTWGFIIGGLFATGAAWLHWKRFKVPIAIAGGTAAAVLLMVMAAAAVATGYNGDVDEDVILPVVTIGGLIVFAFAMWWDMQDRQRTTRRSDVAFWLHLLAAPLIAHPLFTMFGVFKGTALGPAGAIAILVIYIMLGFVALAIDRRALLVSALAYVLAAVGELIENFGAVEAGFAVTMLVIGSALLLLSAAWSQIRAAVVSLLPASLAAMLPPVETAASPLPA